jgi:tetratricopeptide (TPR) repeat protein
LNSYLAEGELKEQFSAMKLVAEEALARYEYERTLEHFNRTLFFLADHLDQATTYQQICEVRCCRAELLVQLGRWDQAMEDIDRIIGRTGTDVPAEILIRAYICGAQVAAYYGDFTQAVSILESALDEHRKLQPARTEVASFATSAMESAIQLELGTIYARIGEIELARNCFNSIDARIGQSDPDKLCNEERLVLAASHAQIGLSLFREGRLEESKQNYPTTLRLCQTIDNSTKLEADTYRYLGILCNTQGKNLESLRHHHRALRIYLNLKLSLGQAKTYSSIGQSCLDLSRLEEALYFTHKAEKISRRLGAEAEVAAIYGKLGNLYVQMGDYGRAVDFHLKDVEMCRRFGNYRAIAYAMNNLGLSYRKKGEANEALHYLQESLSRFIELGDPLQATRLHLDLARTFLDRSRIQEAQNQLDLAKGLIEKSPHNPHQGYYYLLQGTTARLDHQLTESQLALAESLKHLQDQNSSGHLAYAHFELGMLNSELNQKTVALMHFKEALRVSRAQELRQVMIDCIQQIEMLDELELMQVLIEDVVTSQRPVDSGRTDDP